MSIFLETKRLVLKLTEQSDKDNLFKLRMDPDVMKDRKVQTKEEILTLLDKIILHHQKYGLGFYSVFEKESGDFVGQAGLFYIGFDENETEIEVGYRLHKKFWGKGYATELAKTLLQWGFENLEVNKLVAFTHPDNTASQHVLQKCGMISIGPVSCFYGPAVPKYEIYRK